jgi:hypothetical protein
MSGGIRTTAMTMMIDNSYDPERGLDPGESFLFAEQEVAEERLQAARYRALKAKEHELDAEEELLRCKSAFIPHRDRCAAAQKKLRRAQIMTGKANKDVYAAIEAIAAISRKISAHIVGLLKAPETPNQRS